MPAASQRVDGGRHGSIQARSDHTGPMRLAVEPSLRPEDYPFRHRIRVRFAETDAMGIVHHSRYLPYFEEARVEYLRHIGHPYTLWREQGVDAAVLEVFVRYRQALRFDDVVDVHLLLAVGHPHDVPDGLPADARRHRRGDRGDRARRRHRRRPADPPARLAGRDG